MPPFNANLYVRARTRTRMAVPSERLPLSAANGSVLTRRPRWPIRLLQTPPHAQKATAARPLALAAAPIDALLQADHSRRGVGPTIYLLLPAVNDVAPEYWYTETLDQGSASIASAPVRARCGTTFWASEVSTAPAMARGRTVATDPLRTCVASTRGIVAGGWHRRTADGTGGRRTADGAVRTLAWRGST